MIILEMIFNYRLDIRHFVPQMDEKCASSTIACEQYDKLIHTRARPVKKNALLHLFILRSQDTVALKALKH
jgi:hypothetical protein